MAQLLVRDLDEALVKKLKRRARAHGVSTEEEHRRILNEVLSRAEEKERTLIEFLLSIEGEVAPAVELEFDRSREIETRETGI
jgi:plasmid stability protein